MKVVLFANTDWYLYNFRRSLAEALRQAGHEVLLVSPDGCYGHELLNMGFRWTPAPMDRRSLNPLRELVLLFWLRALLRRERVDLIHGFTIKCAVYGAIAGRLARTPARVSAVAGMGYVFTNRDLKARVLRPLVRALLRIAFGGAGGRLILQNPDDAALFEDARIVDARNVRVIPGSGVNCAAFQPAPKPATPPLRVVLPARLLWDKGVAEFVEAARILRKQGRSIEFLLAGEPDPGNPAAVPEPTLKEWCSEGVVQWLGHVRDMPALFRSVHIVALPSYREGLPKGLIEAASSELALVTTDAPGCREVVKHDVDGLLVPVGDAKALASAIAALDDDADLRARLARAARQKAVACFDEKLVIHRTLAVYHELVELGSVSAPDTNGAPAPNACAPQEAATP